MLKQVSALQLLLPDRASARRYRSSCISSLQFAQPSRLLHQFLGHEASEKEKKKKKNTK